MVEYNKFPKQGRRVSTKGVRDLQQKVQNATVVSSELLLLDTLKQEIEFLRGELSKKPEQTGKMISEEEMSARINNAVVDSVNEVKTHYERQMKELRESLRADNDTKQLKRDNSKLRGNVEDLRREKQFAEERLKLVEHTLKQKETEFNSRAKEVEKLQAEVVRLHTQNEQLENYNSDLKSDIKELKDMLTSTSNRMESLMAAAHEGVEIIDPDRPKMDDVFIDPSNETIYETHLEVEDTLEDFEKETLDDKVDKLKGLFGGKLPIGRR